LQSLLHRRSKMKGWLALLVFTGGCGLIPGRSCTLMGCSDALSVVLTPEEALADGAWEVEVIQEDGSSELCAFEIEGGVVGQAPCEAFGTEGSPTVQVDFPAGEGGVTVEVRHEGELIHTEDFAPEYEELAPNGPECGPICRRAAVEVLLAT
jgi:hypothetical protein